MQLLLCRHPVVVEVVVVLLLCHRDDIFVNQWSKRSLVTSRLLRLNNTNVTYGRSDGVEAKLRRRLNDTSCGGIEHRTLFI